MKYFGPLGGVFGAGSIDGGRGGGDLPEGRACASLTIRRGGVDCLGAVGKGGAFMRRTAVPVAGAATGSPVAGVVGPSVPSATLAYAARRASNILPRTIGAGLAAADPVAYGPIGRGGGPDPFSNTARAAAYGVLTCAMDIPASDGATAGGKLPPPPFALPSVETTASGATAGGKPPPPSPPAPAARDKPSPLALAFEVVALTRGGAGTPFGGSFQVLRVPRPTHGYLL